MSYPLDINVQVTPALSGWKVHVYWRDPFDEPPYNWVGPIEERTNSAGIAVFDMGLTYSPIPIWIVVPQQTYPGASHHTLAGITYAESEIPVFSGIGYVTFDKEVSLTPQDIQFAEAVLTGRALGGFPVPDMTLEFLVNGAPVKEVTYPSVSIGAEYSLAHTFDTPGSQTIEGRMTLENLLTVSQFETEPLNITVLDEVLASRVFAATCNLVISQGSNPYATVSDQTGDLFTRNYLSDIWSYLTFNLGGIEGIQSAEFGVYCYKKYHTGSVASKIQTCNPFTCPTEVRHRPSAITTLAQDLLTPPQWFSVSNPALLSYVQSRENDSANFRLTNETYASSSNLFTYYSRHGPSGYRPYLDLTYLKYD